MSDATHVKRWLGLAVASLVLAGVLSLVLVVGRMPGLHGLFTDPLFFKRGLVVHVDLALVIWFYAFLTSLYLCIPLTRRSPSAPSRPPFPLRAGSGVAAMGVVAMVAAAGIPGAEPVLANYVPVVDTPLFVGGLVLFGVGVLSSILGRRLVPAHEAEEGFFPLPAAARVGLRAAALALVLAALTFCASVLVTSRGLPPDGYYEIVAWGGGHVLQFASVAGMLVAWIVLVSLGTGRPPFGRATAVLLFGILILPLLAAPLLALHGTTHAAYRSGFTDLMRWGIFPAVLVVLGLCVRAILRARRAGTLDRHPLREPRLVAFAVSAALTLIGFVLGALIRGSNTVIPAHYHASIGAVTVAYMAITYPLLERLGMSLPRGRWRQAVAWQPFLFGAGQLVFAIGFALAGSHGMARKVYGAEQHIRSAGEWIGLGVMGFGGLAAVAGGVVFLWVVIRAWVSRSPATAEPVPASQAFRPEEGGIGWNAESIQSRG